MEQGYYSVIATPREALYEAACAMDNQDVPLEDWPVKLIAALARAGFAVVPVELPHDALGRAAMQEIILRLKAAETDAAHQKTLAESALRVAEGWERKCDALRAKITEMKKQEPVRHEFQGRDGDWYPFIDQRHYENTVADGSWPIRALYALPGAKGE